MCELHCDLVAQFTTLTTTARRYLHTFTHPSHRTTPGQGDGPHPLAGLLPLSAPHGGRAAGCERDAGTGRAVPVHLHVAHTCNQDRVQKNHTMTLLCS